MKTATQTRVLICRECQPKWFNHMCFNIKRLNMPAHPDILPAHCPFKLEHLLLWEKANGPSD